MRNQPSASNASRVLRGVEIADAHLGAAHEQLAVVTRSSTAPIASPSCDARIASSSVLVAIVGASVEP